MDVINFFIEDPIIQLMIFVISMVVMVDAFTLALHWAWKKISNKEDK